MTDQTTETSDSTVTGDQQTQQQTTDWRSSLPEELRDAPFFKEAAGPNDALKQIQNAASYMGNSLRIPGENAGEDDWKAFNQKLVEKVPGLMPKPGQENMEEVYAALGRPDKPEGYVYEPPEDVDLPTDYEAFAKVAHKHGLSQAQFKGLLDDVVGQSREQVEIAQAEHNQEMKDLNNEWGMAYDKNVSAVKNFLKLTDAPEGIQNLIEEGAMSAAELKWIHSIATATKSPTELATHQSNSTVMTPQEARNQIQEILNNSDHPYWKPNDPRNRDAIDKMVQLQRMANAS